MNIKNLMITGTSMEIAVGRRRRRDRRKPFLCTKGMQYRTSMDTAHVSSRFETLSVTELKFDAKR